MWFDEASGKCTYFQDRRRKWPFTTNEKGKDLLKALVGANSALRERNRSLLVSAGNADDVEREGERLYVEKPTLRGDANVTWSYDEYGHPGLQLYYLKLKSWQRFTETFALLERAGRRGLFDAPLPEGRPLRIAALGGGPGYELFAAQRYFETVLGVKDLQCINTDIQPTWREYSEALGFSFSVFDIFDGKLHEAEVQALYSRAIAPFWDVQAGVRQDFRPDGDDTTHLTVGVQGVAPYWFEMSAAAFLSTEGDLTARAEAEYDQRITQKWILQPAIEVALSARDIPELEIGSGLTSVTAGLRLRYEIRKEFAPYVGVEWTRSLGDTADYAKARGQDPEDTRFVVGIKAWF